MTDEELLKYIKENECYVIPKNNFWVDGIDVSEAIEKQIPKKPLFKKGRYYFSCPVCGADVRRWDEYFYCKKCGTRMDWSDEE